MLTDRSITMERIPQFEENQFETFQMKTISIFENESAAFLNLKKHTKVVTWCLTYCIFNNRH